MASQELRPHAPHGSMIVKDHGDYLAVEDTLPDPALGQGYYYITAVHHQGQLRYGRKSSGGVLTGRVL